MASMQIRDDAQCGECKQKGCNAVLHMRSGVSKLAPGAQVCAYVYVRVRV
jgi:hypothetical protein